jgi:signal transduction histidine kinase
MLRALIGFDPEALAQAFTNLLDNAARYSGAARRIKVALAGGKTEVTLTVTDYGIGIAPEEQEKIFEKFYRVSTGLVHDIKGSGLGLAIVRHIVNAHAGCITVSSQPGRVSTFTIHLPVNAAAQLDQPVKAELWQKS